jgi:hypothetical protein
MLLKLEEYAVRKAPHSRAATVPVHDRELQWLFRYSLDHSFDRQGETLAKLWTDVFIPRPCFQQILIRLGVQTSAGQRGEGLGCQQAEQHLLDTAGAGGLELLLDSGLQ